MPSTSPHQSSDVLYVEVLGGFRVRLGGSTLDVGAWRRRKAHHLLALLALTPGHALHRDRLLDALWPELEPRAAANNLRVTLHVTRRRLGLDTPTAAFLRWQGQRLALGPAGRLGVDADAFEAAARAARSSRTLGAYEAALSLYAGDLLPDALYEDWAAPRREALRDLHIALLVEVAGLHEEAGDLARAAAALQRAVAEDPAHEQAHRVLMRLYAAMGRRRQALRQYARLAGALAEELAAEPDADSRALLRRIEAGLPHEAAAALNINGLVDDPPAWERALRDHGRAAITPTSRIHGVRWRRPTRDDEQSGETSEQMGMRAAVTRVIAEHATMRLQPYSTPVEPALDAVAIGEWAITLADRRHRRGDDAGRAAPSGTR